MINKTQSSLVQIINELDSSKSYIIFGTRAALNKLELKTGQFFHGCEIKEYVYEWEEPSYFSDDKIFIIPKRIRF